MDDPRVFILEQLDSGMLDYAAVAEALLAIAPKETLERVIQVYGWDLSDEEEPDYPEERIYTDLSDDAEALASAGMGTDEDYGHFGGDEY